MVLANPAKRVSEVIAPRALVESAAGEGEEVDDLGVRAALGEGGGEAAGGGEAPADSLWYALVPVARGRHAYKYLVDGSRWLADPHNARQTADGVGGVASVLVVP